ncbi:MAG: hypothetical protein Q8K67_11335 [Geothrix sp.]|nr:hypothetical protein [Geothrix sp.]
MRKLKETVAALEKKGFTKREGRDYNFRFHTKDGAPSGVKTRVPKGRGDLQPWEVHGLRKDLGLTEPELLALIDCPMSREKLEQILRERGLIQ